MADEPEIEPEIEPEDTPRTRIAAAIKGKPKLAYVQVLAADVVAAGATSPDHPLVFGARNALAGLSESAAADLVVTQTAGHLADLLARTGG